MTVGRLTREGKVAAVRDGVAWIAVGEASGCSACASGFGCGIGPVAQLLRRKTPALVPVPLEGRDYRPGMTVRLAVSGARVARTAALVYLGPLVAMFGGAAAAGWLAPQPTDAVLLAGALAGLAASWLLLATWHGRKLPADSGLTLERVGR